MNATFLSSGNALAAGAVATPDTAQASGQPAGVFQALLAGQNPQQTTANTASGNGAPAENTLARIVLPSAPGEQTTGEQKLLQPSVSRELAQLNPELRNAAEDVATVFGQLRSLIAQIRDALPTPPGTPTGSVVANLTTTNPALAADQAMPGGSVLPQTTTQTVAGATAAPLPPTSDRLDVQSLLAAAAGNNAGGAVSSTPPTVTAPSPAADPLIEMLEPLRQQLAALGIDIDTLAQQAGATNTFSPPGLVAKAPVQDQINTLATGKAVKPVQDVLTAVPTGSEDIAEASVDMLSKARPPEPHRPAALPTQGETVLQHIAARFDGLKQQLAETGLPDTIIQALESTINTVNSLAQRPLPASIVMEQLQASASASTPSTKTPVQSPIPVIAGSAPAQPIPAPIAAPEAAPAAAQAPAVSAPPAVEATAPAPSGQAVTSSDPAPQPAQDTSATAKQAVSAAKPAVQPAEAKAPAFAAPPVTPAAFNSPAASGLTPVVPTPPASNPAASGQAMSEPAPELSVAAAAHSARPTSAPGAQLAERNAKPANASKGVTGTPGPNPAQASATTQSSQPVATPSVTPTIDTTAPDLRPMAPMPGQASLDQPLLQSQSSTDTSLSFRPEQDLSLQRADGRLVAERAASEGQRFTPQSAQQLAAQITKRFANGSRVFDIRLDPAELGRVDVRLELSQDQRVQAILSAERPETLAELQRSARELERALNEAGLELEKDGLEFQLSENSDDPGYNADEDPDVMPVFVESDDLEMSALANDTTIERDAYGFRLAAARDRLDVRI